MLKVRDLVVHYGAIQALHDAFIDVHEGEIVALIGGNGSGKSTMLQAISGVLKPTTGSVEYKGEHIEGKSAEQMIKMGICLSPPNHRCFDEFTVYMNLEIGAYTRKDHHQIKLDIEEKLDRFPALAERRDQKAGLLSGGEQQMLTLSRALMCKPELLLLDEPSVGLSPVLIKQVFEFIQEIRDGGTTILLVEQNARSALQVADRAYVLANGEVCLHGPADEMINEEQVQRAYFGAV
jgi:branched-chain amino acid transport system ATP-binding protein